MPLQLTHKQYKKERLITSFTHIHAHCFVETASQCCFMAFTVAKRYILVWQKMIGANTL